MSDMWMDPAEDPRWIGVPWRGEREVVLGYLRQYRMTFEMRCEGLDAEQLARRSVPPSTMSLLGMVRHLASVEHTWFQRVLQGSDEPRPYLEEPTWDQDWTGAVPDDAVVAEAWERWRREIARAEEWLALDVAWDHQVDHHEGPVEVRDILVHLVEEYARHCGHADLLRECIDGRTGQ